MPDTEENKKSEQVVDIDTSGPAVDVELPESKTQEVETDKTYENERETKLEDNNKSDDTVEKSDEQLDVRTEQDDTKPVEEKN